MSESPTSCDIKKIKLSTHIFLIKLYFLIIWLAEIIHWNILMNGHTTMLLISFNMYRNFKRTDSYYFIIRMFVDFFTCFIGLGGAMWTFESSYALPCILAQVTLIIGRVAVWSRRYFLGETIPIIFINDKIILICEFCLPVAWIILALMIGNVSRRLRDNEKGSRPGSRPMVTVLDENGESEMAFGSQLDIALERLYE